MIILCIFGSRTISDVLVAHRAIYVGLQELGLKLRDIEAVASGMAQGMDERAVEWAGVYAKPVLPFPADWKNLDAPGAVIKRGPRGRFNAKAGFDRNQQMADTASHFIGVRDKGKSNGTDDMAERVLKAGKPFAWIEL